MHFSRSLAGVALLGVFAAMAFAGAATGAPAQSEVSMANVVPGTVEGTKMQLKHRGLGRMISAGGKPVQKDPYKAILQMSQKAGFIGAGTARSIPRGGNAPAALKYKAPTGLNAAAVASQDQPITGKHATVLSRTGVNLYQQEQFGGYSLEPPDPSLCAGQGFVIQVVNSQVQISDGNLNKLTAPISMEAFFGDFVNSLFDPLCSYNHSTGKWYMTEAVSDFATFSGVYIAVSTSSDPRSPWNIYFLDLATFGGDDPDGTAAGHGCAPGPLPRRPAEPRVRPVHDLDLDEPVRPHRCGVCQRLLWRCVRPHRQGRAGARVTVPERRRVRPRGQPVPVA